MRRSLPGLLACVMLSACAVIQPTRVKSSTTLPPALRQHSKPDGPTTELPKAPLTLERALDIALANNPDVVGEGWEIEAAQARKRQASSEHWPSLEIFAAYRHHWHEERLVPARGQTGQAFFSHDIFAGDVVLTVPLLSGGRVVSAVAAADLMVKAADKRLARTREELIFNVKSTYYAILGQDKLIEAIEHSHKALTEHRKKTLQLIEARKAAIEKGEDEERERIETQLKDKNPDYFSYLDIDKQIEALRGSQD